MAEGVLQIHGVTQRDPLFLARHTLGDVLHEALDGEAIPCEGRLQEFHLLSGFGALIPLLTPCRGGGHRMAATHRLRQNKRRARLLCLQREERKGVKA